MVDIFTHFKSRFKEQPDLGSTIEPLVREHVELNQSEEADYERWKNSSAQKDILVWLSRQFMVYKRTPNAAHEGIDFLFSPASKGFRLHPALTNFSDKTVTHLFHYLKERALEMGYGSPVSDTRIYQRPYWDETILRHSLRANNLHESSFGDENESGLFTFAQLTIELMLKDNHLVSLKLEATVPNSEMPRSANDFEELMQAMGN